GGALLSIVGGKFKVKGALVAKYYQMEDSSRRDACVHSPLGYGTPRLYMPVPQCEADQVEGVCSEYGGFHKVVMLPGRRGTTRRDVEVEFDGKMSARHALVNLMSAKPAWVVKHARRAAPQVDE
ncbi:unnamed protein product, partial [Prorocentrum cordatum]